jgi:hypothetical protein
MTHNVKALTVLSLLAIILLNGCSTTKYVRMKDPSKRIVSGCVSVLPPQHGDWYVDKHWAQMVYGPGPCEELVRFASGGGEDIYYIYITTGLRSWSDKLNDENLLKGVRNYQDRQLFGNKALGAENINYESGACEGVKGICAMTYYDFLSPKRLEFKAGGPTTAFAKNKLKPSDKYFYEAVEFFVIEGPYETLPKDSNAFEYEVMYVHVSVHENRDPELKSKAYEFLHNIEFKENFY